MHFCVCVSSKNGSVLTHYCQIKATGSCLRGLEIYTATIYAIVAFTHVEDLEPGMLRTRASVEDDTVVAKDGCVHPVAATDVSHAWNVNTASGV